MKKINIDEFDNMSEKEQLQLAETVAVAIAIFGYQLATYNNGTTVLTEPGNPLGFYIPEGLVKLMLEKEMVNAEHQGTVN